jgi:hypothetical protein
VTGIGSAKDFNTWFETEGLRAAATSSAGEPGSSWEDLLARHRGALESTKDPAERARKELALGVWLHGTIKRALPNYNLDRGFELANIARREERQCLMQSLIISSLMQAMGVDAGIAMVNRNREGEYTNNTHVVVMLKLATGRDVLVDGSYREPLVAHMGLMAMLADGAQRYVRPVYSDGFREIVAYTDAASGRTLPVALVRPMDLGFVKSQIDYFRGERTPGGVIAKRTSAAGLRRSARFFQTSLEECPRNPLPSYMLGQVYEKQGLLSDANRQYRRARDLYSQAGWIPNAVYQAVARTRDGANMTARRDG